MDEEQDEVDEEEGKDDDDDEEMKELVAQGQYVVSDIRCPALHDCEGGNEVL